MWKPVNTVVAKCVLYRFVKMHVVFRAEPTCNEDCVQENKDKPVRVASQLRDEIEPYQTQRREQN